MRHAHRVRTLFHELSHFRVDARHLFPGHRAFQRVYQDAKVLQVFTQVRVSKAVFFPAFGHAKQGKLKGVVFSANAADFAVQVGAETFFSIRETQKEAFLHRLITEFLQQSIRGGALNVVELHRHVGFFGVGETENRGETNLRLHDFAAGCLCFFPISEHVAEALAVFRHVAKNAQGSADENSERAFAAHHHLVKIRPGGRARLRTGAKITNGRDIILRDNQVFNFAVISGVLTGSPRDNPTADAGILKGLREVPAGVSPRRAKFPDGVIQQGFQFWAAHAGFHGDGLVCFVKGNHAVHVLAHVHADAAQRSFHPAGDCGAASEHRHWNAVLGGVSHKADNFIAAARGDHNFG